MDIRKVGAPFENTEIPKLIKPRPTLDSENKKMVAKITAIYLKNGIPTP